MSRKPRIGQCVYCGTNGAVTRDHVPPKCLFPPNTRSNLVTVDACHACNNGFKLDDEYFRVALSIRTDLPSSGNSAFLREQTKRTLRAPSATGFRAAMKKATVQMPIHSKQGIYLGDATALRIDAKRITRIAERIIRGLYANYFDQILPPTHEIGVCLIDLQRDTSAISSLEVQELLQLLGAHGARHQFGNVLDVRYAKADDDRESSFWLVRLHEAFGFFGWSVPKESAS